MSDPVVPLRRPAHGAAPPAGGRAASAACCSGCTTPPPEAYVAGGERARAGRHARRAGREGGGLPRPARRPRHPPTCRCLRAREVYCGGWTQPAARVMQLRGSATDAAHLDALAAGGPLAQPGSTSGVICGAPTGTTLAGGVPGAAARLHAPRRRLAACRHRQPPGLRGRSWPMASRPPLPVIERLATGRVGGGGTAAGGQAPVRGARTRGARACRPMPSAPPMSAGTSS